MKKEVLYPPRLVLLTGDPGSGKTTLSRGYFEDGCKLVDGIIDYLEIEYIEKDEIKFRLSRERRAKVDPDIRKRVYTEIFRRSGQYLDDGRSVLIDASFANEVKNPAWGKKYIELADSRDAIAVFLRCVLPEPDLMQRIKDRDDPIDYEKIKDTASWKKFMEEEPIRNPNCGIEIDTTKDVGENVRLILSILRAQITSPF